MGISRENRFLHSGIKTQARKEAQHCTFRACSCLAAPSEGSALSLGKRRMVPPPCTKVAVSCDNTVLRRTGEEWGESTPMISPKRKEGRTRARIHVHKSGSLYADCALRSPLSCPPGPSAVLCFIASVKPMSGLNSFCMKTRSCDSSGLSHGVVD